MVAPIEVLQKFFEFQRQKEQQENDKLKEQNHLTLDFQTIYFSHFSHFWSILNN